MDDETLKKFINVRFLIPVKIIIGAMLAIVVNTKKTPTFNVLIGDCVTYSIVACILYFTGDYVFYITPKIYHLLNRKEDSR